MSQQQTMLDEEQRALRVLAPALAAVSDAQMVRPSADPHAAAATALLVADYLGQPELLPKLGAVKLTPEAVAQLRDLSRALIAIVTRLGGDYLPDGQGIPGDLVARGEAVRTSISAALDKALPDDPEVLTWLEAIRLGSGVVDLVYDLRTLGEICARKVAQGDITGGSARAAFAAADAVEFALRTGDTAEQVASRNTVARLWTLFVPAYERAAAAGRAVTRSAGKEQQFPPLALVASHRRARRRPVSLVPAARRSSPPAANRPSRPPPSLVKPAKPMSLPKPPSLPSLPKVPAVPHDVEMVEMLDADDVVEASPSRAPSSAPAATTRHPSSHPSSLPPHPATAQERQSWSDTRSTHRQIIEIEVGISSQSNFYVGFTENLSASGVFVATYAAKPIGSQVDVALAFPNGDQIKLSGVVRWLREATTDGWPGMGVQFEGVGSDDEAKIRKFLSLRDPLFYDG
jgi:uncharacterized protein (TIGR02266 family)